MSLDILSLVASDSIRVMRVDTTSKYATLATIAAYVSGVVTAANQLSYNGFPQYLAPGLIYSIPTNTGVFSLVLPLLSTVSVGQIIQVIDIGNFAGLNNITVSSQGSDTILDHNVSSGTYVMKINSIISEFIATTYGWRGISYGG
jgi:hypothetical protein